MNGTALIQEERKRQIWDEEYGAEHDKQYTEGEIISAALSYLNYAYYLTGENRAYYRNQSLLMWPWDDTYWKPSNNKVRNLVKAGALIAAEIDRIQAEP